MSMICINRTTLSTVDFLHQNHQLTRCGRKKASQIYPRGPNVYKFVNNFLCLLHPSLSFVSLLQALFRRF